jgi:NADH-quinone oxidoreductase subunit A
MLTEFGKIFVFLLLALVFVGVVMITSRILRPVRPTKEKQTIYECGETPEGTPWVKFNIRFYVVALIFLIFDVEVVLLIPWAMVYKTFGMGGFIVGAIFLVMLGLGMAYEWRKGDLEWEKPRPVPPVINKKQTIEKTKELEPEELLS